MRLLAVALSGGYPDSEKYALNSKSFILAFRGQSEEALSASDQAWAIDRNFVPAEYSRAIALLAGGRKEEALAAAKLGVERDPDFNVGYSGGLSALLRLRHGGPRLWLPEVDG